MGRIKTLLVKRIAKKLIRDHADEFSSDFEKNKEIVEKYTNVSSPKMRNVIAGYTARLTKQNLSGESQRRKTNEEDFSKFYQ